LCLDALFERFYHRLPHDELFQLYIDYPVFQGQCQAAPAKKPGRPPGSRILQVIFDVVGHPDAGPFIVLTPTVGQFMLDCKAVFNSKDPEQTAGDLVKTLLPRLTKRLEELQQKSPTS
jgi:hypothetical protein